MRTVLIIMLVYSISLVNAQITRGGNNNTEEPVNAKKSEKGVKPVDCNEDLELDPGNKLIYHKKMNKPFSGVCVSYYPNGNLQRKGSFINGKDNDTAYIYYESGDIQAVLSHVDGMENGTWAYWYDNGTADQSQQQLAWANTYEMGNKTGQWYYFDEEGNPTKYQEYAGGLLDGITKYYYKGGGDVKRIVNYKEGKLDGEYLQFYADSVLKSKENYEDDKPEGEGESYFENGNVKSSYAYKDGQRDGEWILYHENGQVKDKGMYKDGKKDGLWEMFKEDGKHIAAIFYDKGELKKSVEYDRFGKPKNDLDLMEMNDLLDNKNAIDEENNKGKKKKKKEKKKKKKDDKDDE